MKLSKSKQVEYKFLSLTDSELAHLYWLAKGAIACKTVIHKSFGGKKWKDDGYELNSMVKLECLRRKIIKEDECA